MGPRSTESRLERCDNDGSAMPGLDADLLYSCDTLEAAVALVRPEFARSANTSRISSAKTQPCSCGKNVPACCSLLIMASCRSLRTDPTGEAGGLPTRERQVRLRSRLDEPSGVFVGRLLPVGSRRIWPAEGLHRRYLTRRIPRSALERRGQRIRRPPSES